MFCIGDKIVYPMHGAGIIEDLQEKDIDGQTRLYYVLNIPVASLTITIPQLKAEDLGVREVYTKEEVLRVLEESHDDPNSPPENWNERYKYNYEKLKTGNLKEALIVYKSLYFREREKGLSGMEKKLLSTAKQIILSELAVSQNIDKNSAEDMLGDVVSKYAAAV